MCYFFLVVCQQPLGMERKIITDSQITASTTYSSISHSGYQARLNNVRSWCSATNAQSNAWVKVDFGRRLSVRGITIQGDPNHPANYITKFKLKFNINGIDLYKIDDTHFQKVLRSKICNLQNINTFECELKRVYFLILFDDI